MAAAAPVAPVVALVRAALGTEGGAGVTAGLGAPLTTGRGEGEGETEGEGTGTGAGEGERTGTGEGEGDAAGGRGREGA